MTDEVLFPICGHFWGLSSKKESIFQILNANLEDKDTVINLKRLTYVFLRNCAVTSVIDWCVKLLQVTDESLIENLLSPDVCQRAVHLLLEKGNKATSTLSNVHSPNIEILKSLMSIATDEPEGSLQVPKILLEYANSDCAVAVCYNSLPFKLLRMYNNIEHLSPSFLQNCAIALLMNLGYIKINENNCRYVINEEMCRPVTTLQTCYSAFTGNIIPVFRLNTEMRNNILDILNVNGGHSISKYNRH